MKLSSKTIVVEVVSGGSRKNSLSEYVDGADSRFEVKNQNDVPGDSRVYESLRIGQVTGLFTRREVDRDKARWAWVEGVRRWGMELWGSVDKVPQIRKPMNKEEW